MAEHHRERRGSLLLAAAAGLSIWAAWLLLATGEEAALGVGGGELRPEGADDGGREAEPVRETSAAVVNRSRSVSTAGQSGDANGALAEIHVIVVDSFGRGVGDAELTVTPPSRAADERVATVVGRTGPDGSALLAVEAGGGRFVGAKKGQARALLTFVAGDLHAGTAYAVRLTMVEDDVTIAGAVVDQDDRPIAGADVFVQERRVFGAAGSGLGTDVAVDSRQVTSDAAGEFTVAVSRTRTYQVLARRDGRSSRIVTVGRDPGSPRRVTLTMPSRVVLQGHVVDWRGEPAVDYEVFVGKGRGKDADSAMVRTDARGDFFARFHEGGQCDVIPIGNASCAAGRAEVVTLPRLGTVPVVLAAARGVAIRGRVVGLRGATPARVVASPRHQNLCHQREVVADRAGEFEIGALMDGWEYDVCAFVGDERIAVAQGIAGGGTPLELTAPPR